MQKWVVYFHDSVMEEAARSWITHKKETICGGLILKAFLMKIRYKERCPFDWFICPHTFDNLHSNGMIIAFDNISNYNDIIQIDKSSIDDISSLNHDEKFFKTAAVRTTKPVTVLVVCNDSECQSLSNLAKNKGYEYLKIMPASVASMMLEFFVNQLLNSK